jgi:hypothetical protein
MHRMRAIRNAGGHQCNRLQLVAFALISFDSLACDPIRLSRRCDDHQMRLSHRPTLTDATLAHFTPGLSQASAIAYCANGC